jgi:hypothetical protein
MRDALEDQIIQDGINGDTTVLAELLSLVPIHLIYGALSDELQEKFKMVEIYSQPYAISTSDGHDEDWTYYDSEREVYERFEYMKEYETDVHLFKLTLNNEYEVIDSWYDENN